MIGADGIRAADLSCRSVALGSLLTITAPHTREEGWSGRTDPPIDPAQHLEDRSGDRVGPFEGDAAVRGVRQRAVRPVGCCCGVAGVEPLLAGDLTFQELGG